MGNAWEDIEQQQKATPANENRPQDSGLGKMRGRDEIQKSVKAGGLDTSAKDDLFSGLKDEFREQALKGNQSQAEDPPKEQIKETQRRGPRVDRD